MNAEAMLTWTRNREILYRNYGYENYWYNTLHVNDDDLRLALDPSVTVAELLKAVDREEDLVRRARYRLFNWAKMCRDLGMGSTLFDRMYAFYYPSAVQSLVDGESSGV
jgi:hypothetical protein